MISSTSSETVLKLPARTQSCVRSAKNRSTMFIQELEVGVKCMWNLGWVFNHPTTFSCLCVL